MNKLLAMMLLSFLIFTACDPLEVGEPPVFSSFQAKQVGSTQLSLSWTRATDDRLDTQEIAYGIWVSEPDGEINVENDPTYITGKGAYSYSLRDLEAGETYQIEVRALETNTYFSAEEHTKTITVATSGNDIRFGTETTVSITSTPDKLAKGFIFRRDAESVAMISGSQISWFSDGAVVSASSFTASGNIDEAHFLDLDPSDDDVFHDMVLLENSQLYVYQNNGSGSGTVFTNGVTIGTTLSPDPGTLSFLNYVNDEETTVLIGFMDGDRAYIYELTSDRQFESRANLFLGDDYQFQLAYLDDDDHPDLVAYGPNGLEVAYDNNADFDFEAFQDIDDNDDRPSDVTYELNMSDTNGDGLADVHVFLSSTTETNKKIQAWAGSGSSFSAMQEKDYGTSFYVAPMFSDLNGDGFDDLLLTQTASNNVAFFPSLSITFGSVDSYYGGEGDAKMAISGNLDGTGDPDLVIFSDTDLTYLKSLN